MDRGEAYKLIEKALNLGRSKEEAIIATGTPSLDHGVFYSALVALQSLKPQDASKPEKCQCDWFAYSDGTPYQRHRCENATPPAAKER